MRHGTNPMPKTVSLGIVFLLGLTAWALDPEAHLKAMAVPDFTTTITAPSNKDLARRAEAEGSSCSPEGQWNCITNTWQRCAGGRWSVVMDSAAGTVCRPAGQTSDFRIEHDGNAGGSAGGGAGGAGTTSGASRGSVGVGAFVAVALLSWTVLLH
ncbi:uncharacterized protein HRG_02629 [Hirsutella rhossiliensis]|uniref:Uncharacterized protein n=1 Tax=Hirsutella rhossiliensis TaxID=111463 RepID=A0A9P8SMU2_9HYPO|nr:uncharacterized protein HRG_02629 [Hirsutella rhossiliensis]KAH0967220.1 hypothetical protein HRG_02629 [Hirsutella rhossiliensis]